ncbi:MAG: rod shape-determining protein MreD [Pelovirga sp.]
MSRALLYSLVGTLFLLLQSSVFPLFLAPQWRPDLFLILILVIGVKEKSVPSLVAALLLGASQDSLGGTTSGLHIIIYLLLLILTRLLAEKLNVDSPPLFLLMVPAATLAQTLLFGFFLANFTDAGGLFLLLAGVLPGQLVSNLLATVILLGLFARLKPARIYRAEGDAPFGLRGH